MPLSFNDVMHKIATGTYKDDEGLLSSRLYRDLKDHKFDHFSLDQKVQLVVQLNFQDSGLLGLAINMLDLGKEGEVKVANELIEHGEHHSFLNSTRYFKHLTGKEMREIGNKLKNVCDAFSKYTPKDRDCDYDSDEEAEISRAYQKDRLAKATCPHSHIETFALLSKEQLTGANDLFNLCKRLLIHTPNLNIFSVFGNEIAQLLNEQQIVELITTKYGHQPSLTSLEKAIGLIDCFKIREKALLEPFLNTTLKHFIEQKKNFITLAQEENPSEEFLNTVSRVLETSSGGVSTSVQGRSLLSDQFLKAVRLILETTNEKCSLNEEFKQEAADLLFDTNPEFLAAHFTSFRFPLEQRITYVCLFLKSHIELAFEHWEQFEVGIVDPQGFVSLALEQAPATLARYYHKLELPLENEISSEKIPLPPPAMPAMAPGATPPPPPPGTIPPPPPPPLARPAAPKVSLKDRAQEKANKIQALNQKIEEAKVENVAARKRIKEIDLMLATLGREQPNDPSAAISSLHKEIREKTSRLRQLNAIATPENQSEVLQQQTKVEKELSLLATRKDSLLIAKALRDKELLEQGIKEDRAKEKDYNEQISSRKQQVVLLSEKIALGSSSRLKVNGVEITATLPQMQNSKKSLEARLIELENKQVEVQQKAQEKLKTHDELHQQRFMWNGSEHTLGTISVIYEECSKEKQDLEQACAGRDRDKKTWQTELARLERVVLSDPAAPAQKREVSAPRISIDANQLKLKALERALETGQIDHLE